jgi:hypothetical protein
MPSPVVGHAVGGWRAWQPPPTGRVPSAQLIGRGDGDGRAGLRGLLTQRCPPPPARPGRSEHHRPVIAGGHQYMSAELTPTMKNTKSVAITNRGLFRAGGSQAGRAGGAAVHARAPGWGEGGGTLHGLAPHTLLSWPKLPQENGSSPMPSWMGKQRIPSLRPARLSAGRGDTHSWGGGGANTAVGRAGLLRGRGVLLQGGRTRGACARPAPGTSRASRASG